MKLLFVTASLCFFLLFLGFVSAENGAIKDHHKFILGQENLGPWKNEILALAEAPGSASHERPQTTLVLAANRTNRPDILCGFKRYRGGWDITSRHYWASVGFTGSAAFILSVLWFISFGIVLVIHHCCGWRINIKGEGSKLSQKICLTLLLVFTCAAAIGCILLSIGQDKFHGEALHTLNYVVNQSDYTVQILRNVTQYLSLAKDINVAQVFLPSDIMDDIDKLNVDLNTAADTLTDKTSENSIKIKKVFNLVRSALITVAALMLVLALIGLVLSVLGYQHAIHIFIISGWLLVAITFILCGVFVILNNAISDTCMAMQEWVENPHAETALSNILPCVDQKTTNQTLTQSKQTINGIVSVVNQFIYTYANPNPSEGAVYSYNQSGPLMPPLCYPFDSHLQDNHCGDQEVTIANASLFSGINRNYAMGWCSRNAYFIRSLRYSRKQKNLVWLNYTCKVSSAGICTTVGRVTPDIYTQLTVAVNESYALEHYTPLLLSLQDCNFVRDTFRNITSGYCPPLDHYLKMVYVGLATISVGVWLCLVLWILYANRPQREEVFVKLSSLIKGRSNKSSLNNNDSNNQVSSSNTAVEV